MDENELIAILARLYHEREISEDEIERRAEQGDLVYGVWPDSTKPHRFDYGVLKGDELHLRGPVHHTEIMVVPCKSPDDAIRTKNMFFDTQLGGLSKCGFKVGSTMKHRLRAQTRLISPPDFRGRRGILYYGVFKPTVSYELTDRVWIVPSGWEMLSLPSMGSVARGTRSHFVAPDDWNAKTVWQAFRDWVVFDSFLFMHYATINYDNNLFIFQDVTFRVGGGSVGDAGDTYNALDYGDVTSFLVDEFMNKPKHLDSISYKHLYQSYLTLPDPIREAIEWFVSPPTTYKRKEDAFTGHYWGFLHKSILVDHLIGDPPICDEKSSECTACGRIPERHYKLSRKDWLWER